jgi:hypothetical protein
MEEGGGGEVDPERVGRGEEGGMEPALSSLIFHPLHLLYTGARLHWIGGGGGGVTQGRSRFLNVIPSI